MNRKSFILTTMIITNAMIFSLSGCGNIYKSQLNPSYGYDEDPTEPVVEAVIADETVVAEKVTMTEAQTIVDAILNSTEVTTEASTVVEEPTTVVEESTKAPPIEEVTEPVTEAATEPVTEAATEPVTEAVTQPVTQPAATQPPTQPATVAPTQLATQPVTQAPTEAVTQPVTQAPTQPAPAQTGSYTTQQLQDIGARAAREGYNNLGIDLNSLTDADWEIIANAEVAEQNRIIEEFNASPEGIAAAQREIALGIKGY